ncbi:bifunctional RNase H/acid phosphatase [Corynebacterium felinum]|uniref:Phosphoglycerate mutase n=1 Tax=Corynebacterium felinum TaxID=131318 RepID=A0ABU2BC80_9CORY|nr:bifunctional RNase H/acid phosphatase [Corynebacterium felinum]MDF5820046.1 bifunctional RNase H/acid phosphatase [Corynebacterium felinum]MDR7356240.1 putative phosphoglycerate mutase [Corynebacterium felinum]WJY95572.1 Phosphoserine phosphatase 1 [Corynebacterium felinum]
MKVIIEADGGSRGNPGVAGSGTVIYDANNKILREISYIVGEATNNVAEYYGLLNGLAQAKKLGATDVSVRMDSKLVVEQMSGRWKIKHPDMKELALECQKIMRTFNTVEFEWIPRNKNAAADALANKAMDAREQGAEPGFLERDDADTTPAGSSNASDNAAGTAGVEQSSAKTCPTSWNGATSQATRLILLRHGQTPYSAKRLYSGLSDPELTDLGLWQAEQAARRLGEKGGVAAVISSPLRRCTQTAEACARALGVEVVTDSGLVEMDFGDWDGLSFSQAFESDPQLHSQWLKDVHTAPPGGESLVSAHKRIKKCLNELLRTYQGQTIVLVSHVTPIKSILRVALDGNASMVHRMHLDLASMSIAEFYSDGPTCVRLLNDTSHLKVR